jgi:hypothetical protein
MFQNPRPLNESSEPDATELPGELRALEAALGTLRPSVGRLDRDRLLFEAGRRAALESRRAARWAWPAATAALGTLAASLLLMLAPRPAPRVVKEIVVKTIRVPVETPSAAPEERAPAPTVAEHRPASSWWRDSAPAWKDGRDAVAMRVRVERLLRELRAPEGAGGSPTRARKTDGAKPSEPRVAPVESPTPYYQLRDQLLREQLSAKVLPRRVPCPHAARWPSQFEAA